MAALPIVVVQPGGQRLGSVARARIDAPVGPLAQQGLKLGVPGPALRTALQVLEIEQRYKIPNMTLTQDHFRELGL